MRFSSFAFFLLSGLALGSFSAQAQQTPAPPAALSDDSVRVMSGLVQASVRQLRAIYFEPNEAQTIKLIGAALHDIPAFNQRLSHYTASLSREQQQVLAQRLRKHPWQIELRTLLNSPQYRGFDARAAKNPELKAAAAQLRTAGFMGTGATPAAVASTQTVTPAPAPAPAATTPVAAPVAATPAAAPKPAVSATHRHTVVKGETLFSIARRYGVEPAQLQAWNGKASSGVKIGEVLTVEASN
ncbi:LysM peptidoglycan-binding domain-containing protein [Hymenobacter tenuis]